MKEKSQQKPGITYEKETLRLIGLSDGLFATVLTLLVLDLKIPDLISPGAGNIGAFIKWIGPHLFSYLLTFLVAGTYWQAHHRDFDLIIHIDRRLLGYNLIFLLFVGLLPFSTAAISLLGSRNGIYPFYWAIYSANIIFAGVLLTLTWGYAVSHDFIDQSIKPKQSRYITLRHLVTPLIFLISILMEYLFPQAFLGAFTLWLIPFGLRWVDHLYAEQDNEGTSTKPARSEILWQLGSFLPWGIMIGLAVWAMTY